VGLIADFEFASRDTDRTTTTDHNNKTTE
jgi:hypothetical protein